MQEPESRSRPLHAGCRRGSKQVAPRLIPGPHTFSWFRHHLKHFDASTRVRFPSPSRSAPDAVFAASFPRRSPPRLLTGAARGGLLPPPARRQRRACPHLLHSTGASGPHLRDQLTTVQDTRTRRLFSGTHFPSSVPGSPVRARAAARVRSPLAAVPRRHAHGGKCPPS